MASGELSGCVIVSGMPGAGKSTVTRLAARLLPRAARVGGDDVSLMIGSGFVGFMGKPADEALRQDELCNRNMCSLATQLRRLRLHRPDGLGAGRSAGTGLLPRAAVAAPRAAGHPRAGIDECRRRNAMRDPQDRFDFDGYERLEADMMREFADCAWWFDTVALTPEESAEQLVAGVAHHAPLLRPGWNGWLRRLHQV